VTPHLSLVGLGQAIGVGAVAFLCGLAVLRAGRRGALAPLALALAVFALLEVASRRHERALRRDLAAVIPPLLAGAARPVEVEAAGRFPGAKLVVLGIDGLCFEVLVPLLRRGELPNLAWLLRGAAYGYLDTLPHTVSPVIWETISTGQPPSRHRIGHHAHWSFPGVSGRVRFLPELRLADNTAFDVRRLVSLVAPFAPWDRVYHDSTDAGVARVWEILDRRGVSVGVYHWPNSAPVSAVRGFMKGYESVPPREWPPDLEQGFDGLPSVMDVLPHERALWRRFVSLARRYRPEALFYYTHFADAANHWNWKRDVVGRGLLYPGLVHADFEPGPEVREANRLVDALVGEALARLPEDATLVVVSDHGFEFNGYEHDNTPPGVIAVRGPEVRAGVIERASVFDVAPTLLHLLGVPVAVDMQGRVLPVWKPGSPLARPPETVASYGGPAQPVAVGEASEEEIRRTQEYLRSLGYVN
jgi:hypothetical protein